MKDLKDMTVDELRKEYGGWLIIGREAFEELARRLSEAERKLAEAEKLCCIACDYLAQHWDLNSAPLHLIKDRCQAAIAAQNRDD